MAGKIVLLLFFALLYCSRGVIIWPAIEKLAAGKNRVGYQPYEPRRESWKGITFLSFGAMFFFVLFAEGPISIWEMRIGLVIYCFGLLLASLGRFNLGVSWADIHKVTSEKQGLATSGIYRLMRNPIYVGVLIMNVGIVISLGVLTDDWAFMPGIICFVGSCLEYRAAMVDEEKFLRRRYGKEYEEYCERVGRYFIKINFSARRRVETAGRGKV
ncbi:MAG: hypothetical protein UV02_C0009G0006 [Candidatus Kuenenbacteria bacterium GW2011_GWA2_42_15]|uniref:Isoprenylcysteine carboxyl methyltransferase n=1 Tax=Candidatus Kuenenbacteria bacterium GW2011_GWA2_42_15 TaxID=1618677 RepID=A0A0G0Z1K7_9BACT|nr:MAG: hypothetical protein UV02_C0009G0006 [Candidatus Kuenenbacteria bacterium GW2011_GWA2_42_15]